MNTHETTISQPVFEDTDDHNTVITRINEVRVRATDGDGNIGESWQRVKLPEIDPAKKFVVIDPAAGDTAAIIAMIPADKMVELKASADADLAKKLAPSKYVELA